MPWDKSAVGEKDQRSQQGDSARRRAQNGGLGAGFRPSRSARSPPQARPPRFARRRGPPAAAGPPTQEIRAVFSTPLEKNILPGQISATVSVHPKYAGYFS